jgi:predicted  nucleic acid-binding Zn-ribbon protein
MRPVILLAQLNEMDLAVDASKARLAEIIQGLREPAGLAQRRTALRAAQTEQARCREAQVAAEIEQRRIADHLAQSEKGLYSGKTKSAKELEHAEHDVQQLRRQLAHAEDELLDALVAMETATENVAAATADLERFTAEWESRRERLRGEQVRVKAQLVQEQARQLAARQAVPDALLVVYDSLRARRAGRAVAEIDGDECGACGVAVAHSTLELAREGDDLVYCGNCGRILWSE